ncbi:hypothetical protein T459_23387 [Capsicum annuum]|uniref:Uncharacterized protein n=1 Tax=Capsicum annuum TaxID=4072 RepID=A0A2G2YS86_CAPAN|nr:hypothetical protein T459_23387 [Capsicum annuum]
MTRYAWGLGFDFVELGFLWRHLDANDAKDPKVNLDPEGIFNFLATSGARDYPYKLKLELQDKVDVEKLCDMGGMIGGKRGDMAGMIGGMEGMGGMGGMMGGTGGDMGNDLDDSDDKDNLTTLKHV